jgi:alkylation response protein AidB-like acyl-CoA dehydrogenase
MEFADTALQAALRDAVRAFADRYGTPERVRTTMASPVGYDRQIWERLTGELGLCALAVPLRHGGAGAGPREVAVAVEELGRVLLPSPFLSTAVAVLALAGAAEDADGAVATDRYLPGLADGSVIGAIALDADVTTADGTVTGTARNVVDGAAAALLLVRCGDRLLAVAGADAQVTPLDTLDQTRRQAAAHFDRAPALAVGPVAPVIALQRVLLAAECVAAAEHCLDATVGYLTTRRQFGRPIGSFQALQHRAADLAVAVVSARATARAAAWTAATDPSGLAGLAPLAALHCSRTFLQVAAEMIQLHGGIGFTWEHEAHLYFKRAKATQLLLGSVSELRAEIGRDAGLTRAEAFGHRRLAPVITAPGSTA